MEFPRVAGGGVRRPLEAAWRLPAERAKGALRPQGATGYSQEACWPWPSRPVFRLVGRRVGGRGSGKPVKAEPMKDEIRLSEKKPRTNFSDEG